MRTAPTEGTGNQAERLPREMSAPAQLEAHVPARVETVVPAQEEVLPELQPLYRLRFAYARAWSAHLGGTRDGAGTAYSVAHGRCEGHLNGEFAGENRPMHGTDGTTIPDFDGVIATEDGATIAIELAAYRHTYLVDRRRMLVAVAHTTEDARYARLNDVACIGVGEVTMKPTGRIEITLDVAEAVLPSM